MERKGEREGGRGRERERVPAYSQLSVTMLDVEHPHTPTQTRQRTPPPLFQCLQVAQQELGHMAPPHDSADSAQQPPTWSQMWKLLEAVATQHQHQQQQGQKAEGGVLATNTAAAGSAVADGDGSAGGGAVQQQQQQGGGEDAASRFERYLREADSVPLTPPPYPGAVVCWLVFCGLVFGVLNIKHVCECVFVGLFV